MNKINIMEIRILKTLVFVVIIIFSNCKEPIKDITFEEVLTSNKWQLTEFKMEPNIWYQQYPESEINKIDVLEFWNSESCKNSYKYYFDNQNYFLRNDICDQNYDTLGNWTFDLENKYLIFEVDSGTYGMPDELNYWNLIKYDLNSFYIEFHETGVTWGNNYFSQLSYKMKFKAI